MEQPGRSTLRLGADLVRVEWDSAGPLSVAVDQGWQHHISAHELLDEVQAQACRHIQCYEQHGWRKHVDLMRVPMDKLRQFNLLFEEARVEAARDPQPELIEVHGEHLVSSWFLGRLLFVSGDVDWLKRATRQEISDELCTILAQPHEPRTENTTSARDRFVRFMEG